MKTISRLQALKEFLDEPLKGDIASDMYEKAMNWQMTGECECQQECHCEYHYGPVTVGYNDPIDELRNKVDELLKRTEEES